MGSLCTAAGPVDMWAKQPGSTCLPSVLKRFGKHIGQEHNSEGECFSGVAGTAECPIRNMRGGRQQAALGTIYFHGINVRLETGMSSDSKLHRIGRFQDFHGV